MIYDDAFLRHLGGAVRTLLPLWGLGETAPLCLLTASENATFAAGEGAGRIVVRVYRPDYHEEAEILSELAWIEAIRRDEAVDTPRPIPTVDGRRLVAFEDGGTIRHAAAFEHRPGAEPEAGDADLPRWFRHLGSVAARLHAHAKAWPLPPGFRRKTWTFETIAGRSAHWGDWRDALGLDAAGREVLEELAARLAAETAAFGTEPDRFGLVHCDMRLANLLIEGERLTVIDFDDCGLCWYGYDFAAAVSFIEHEPVVPALMAAWLDGYRAVAPFPESQERMLPMLVMLRRLQLTAWIASHRETPTARALGSDYTQGTVALAKAYLG